MGNNKLQTDLGNIRTKIKTYQKQGKEVVFSAVFFTGKEKVNLIDRADIKQLSLISKNLKHESPDRIKIELYDGLTSRNPIWFTYIQLKPEEMSEPTTPIPQPLGEVEINHIVTKRIEEIERDREFREMRDHNVRLEEQNKNYETRVAELEGIVETKSQIEYYSNIIGLALPGVAKFFSKTPVGQALGFVAGNVEEKSEATSEQTTDKKQDPDQRKIIIELILEYLNEVDNQMLGNIYLVLAEINKTPAVVNEIIQFLNELNKSKNTI